MRKYKPNSALSQEQILKRRESHKKRQQKYRMNNVAYDDREQRRNYLRHGATWKLDPDLCELVMIDGEADDDGHYNLFQIYSPLIGLRSLRASAPDGRLGIFECARFMLRWQRNIRTVTGKKAKFIAFSYGYDMAQMLYGERLMTDEEKMDVWKQRSRSWGVVRGPTFCPEIRIEAARAAIQNGRKTGYITFDSPSKPGMEQHVHTTRVAWQDCFTLFAKGLVAVLEEYAKFWTPEEHERYDAALEAVKLGKEARGQWREAGYSDEEIAEKYQLPELQLMHWLMTKMQSLCQEVALFPKTFAGPAPMARALMHKHGVTKHLKPAEYDSIEFQEGRINHIVKQSFYGGRIESAVSGLLPQGYHTYDINSAHPSQIAKLPCGAHGYWEDIEDIDIYKLNKDQVTQPYALYHIAWSCPKDTVWGPFPVRHKNKSISYPLQGEGWYCYQEIQAFLDCYTTSTYNILEGIAWVPTCDRVHPFKEMVEETYNARQQYKKSKNPAGNVLKLALNSSFGVMAQTSGSYRKVDEHGETIGYSTPRLSNLFLASLITSGTRSVIMELVAKNPQNVFAIATDAIKCYTSMDGLESVESDDKETDRALGGLEHERHAGAAIISAPGFIGHVGSEDKIRGVPSKCRWESGDTVGLNLFETQRLALERGAEHILARYDQFANPFAPSTTDTTAGRFVERIRIIDITPNALRTKRDLRGVHRIGPYLWYVAPYTVSADGPSYAYERPMDVGALMFERPERFDE